MFVITTDKNVTRAFGPFPSQRDAQNFIQTLPEDQSSILAGSAEALVGLDRASMNYLYRVATGKEVSAKWPSQRSKGARAIWKVLDQVAKPVQQPEPIGAEQPDEVDEAAADEQREAEGHPEPQPEPQPEPEPQPKKQGIHVYVRQILGFTLALGHVPGNAREPMLRKLDGLVAYNEQRGAGQPAKLNTDAAEQAARNSAFYRAFLHMVEAGFAVDDTDPKPARTTFSNPDTGVKGFINQHGETWIQGKKVARYGNSAGKDRIE
jgi:hypothetical protein